MCVYIYVCKGCLDKYISAATWPPKQKFLAPPLDECVKTKLYIKIKPPKINI